MSRKLILSHDVGTSGNKACIFNINGEFLAEASHAYSTYYPAPGYAEQNPEDWWEAVKISTANVIKKANIDPSEVKAISFSAQGLGVIPVDKKGNLLKEQTMVWMDARSMEEAKYILSKTGEREHYEMTGNSFDLSLYPSAKLLWFRKNLPDIYKSTYKFLGTKEFLINKMTGEIKYTDYGEAGMSGLFNINKHEFDDNLIKISQVEREKLLEPVECTTVAGELSKKSANELGLKSGTPVVLGSWDNYASATGGGVQKTGTFVTCLGTAGWLGVNNNKPLMSSDFMSNVVFVGVETYFTSIHSHSACAAFDWVLDNISIPNKNETRKNLYAYVEELAQKIPAGSENLFFLPSMFSGNTFYSDASLAANFLGIKIFHSTGHLIKASMEGIGFDLMMGVDFFRKIDTVADKTILIGGGANSNLWMQIISNMFQMRVIRPRNNKHIGALGAAIIAGVGTGLISDFNIVDSITKLEDYKDPIEKDTEVYRKLLPVFKKFYENLIPVFRELNNL